MKEKVGYDFDDVICNGRFLPLLNQYFGTNYQIKDFKKYFIEEQIGKTEEEIEGFKEFLLTQNLYGEGAALLKDAYDSLYELSKEKDQYIVSSCMLFGKERDCKRLFADKFEFIMDTLPFWDPNKIILCGDKSTQYFSRFVDDRFSNLLHPGMKHRYLFTAFHNQQLQENTLLESQTTRLLDWKHLYHCFSGTYQKEEVMQQLFGLLHYYEYSKDNIASCKLNQTEITLVLKNKETTDCNYLSENLCNDLDRSVGKQYHIQLSII